MQLFVDTQYASPYALSVFVALREKGLPFELTALDLGSGAHLGAHFAAQSLTARIPTLVDGDFTLSESSAITECLDDAYPGLALYPTDVKLRARARQVQAWIRSDLMPIREERPTTVVFYRPSDQPLSPAAQGALAKLVRAAEALLPEGQEHLCGSWSIADVDLALMLQRLIKNGDALPARLADYAERQWQRPSVQAWVARQRAPL